MQGWVFAIDLLLDRLLMARLSTGWPSLSALRINLLLTPLDLHSIGLFIVAKMSGSMVDDLRALTINGGDNGRE